jgi:hypothetical protein
VIRVQNIIAIIFLLGLLKNKEALLKIPFYKSYLTFYSLLVEISQEKLQIRNDFSVKQTT